MKICPTCQQTYTDDNLNFCLNDGSILSLMSGQNVPPNTVFMNPPRPTSPSATFGNQPGEQVTLNQQQVQPYSVQPKKSSKNWIWVVGILGLIVVLCGGSFGLMAIIGSQIDTKNTSANYNRSPNNTGTTNQRSTPGSDDDDDRTLSQPINLQSWVRDSSEYGTTSFSGGELTMGSKKRGFYYVLVAPAEYKTENATTKVVVRNASNANSSLGYGLIFHSNPEPLQQDYAFLIDTLRRKYRIVYHAPQKETVAVDWTSSDAIKDGTQTNVLEVRDSKGSMQFYINGQKVNTQRNSSGYGGGVAGLYAGDAAQISFSKLEIYK